MTFGGIDRCACKRGFYTLRDCGRQATATCSMCSRRICDEHLAPRVDATVCAECAARQEEGHIVGGSAPPETSGPFGSYGAAGMGWRQAASYRGTRHRFGYYQRSGYRPMFWGTYDPYWSSDDYQSYGGDEPAKIRDRG